MEMNPRRTPGDIAEPGETERLIIAGAGSLAQNLCAMARLLEYRITVIDHSPELLTRERFPGADELWLGDIVEQIRLCTITENTSIVIVTHHHEFDQTVLEAVVDSPARYIGLLGNSHKVKVCFSKLSSLGVADELMNKIHMPVGLDIGGKTAAEVALAIMAEIQAVRYGRSGGFVTIKRSQRSGAKHDHLF